MTDPTFYRADLEYAATDGGAHVMSPVVVRRNADGSFPNPISNPIDTSGAIIGGTWRYCDHDDDRLDVHYLRDAALVG